MLNFGLFLTMQRAETPHRLLGKRRAGAQRGGEMASCCCRHENCFPQLRFVIAFISRLYLLIRFLCFVLFVLVESSLFVCKIVYISKYPVTLLFVLFPIKAGPPDVNSSLHIHVYMLFQSKWERRQIHWDEERSLSNSESDILRDPFCCINVWSSDFLKKSNIWV